MKKYVTLIGLLSMMCLVNSQIYQYKINDYHNQTISTCNGLFLDDGGQGHWMNTSFYHQDAQDYVTTICNPNLNDSIYLKLFAFKSGASQPNYGNCPNDRDLLSFYAGNSTSSPCMFSISGKNVYTNTCGPTNPTFPYLMANLGCITVQWHADCSNNAMGWEIGIHCERPDYSFYADASVDCDAAQPVASNICSNAPMIPLDQPFCGTTSASFTPEPQASLAGWCDNYGAAYKSSWYSFIADTTFVSFEVYVNNCTGGTLGMPTGIQMQIFQTPDCVNFSAVSNCMSTGALSGTGVPLNLRGGQDGYVFATNLVPGQQYYILIGGYYNDVCNYAIVPSNTNPYMVLDLTNTPDSCAAGNKGRIVASVGGSGIAAPITYQWNPASGLPNQPATSPNLNPFTITNLPAGTYTVTATDANGTTATATTTIVGVPLVSSQPSVVSTTCGHNNGTITFLPPTNGTPQYQYSINGGNTYSGSLTFQNLAAGDYVLVIKDAHACENRYTVQIQPSTGINLSMSHNNETCTQANGNATVNVSGGVPPYVFDWNTTTENTTNTAINLSAGTYTVTVSDASGCTNNASASIIDSGLVFVNVSTITANCDQANGSASAITTGQTTNLTYIWNANSLLNTQTITNLLPGTYSVVVSNGVCNASAVGIVGNTPGPTAAFEYRPNKITIENPTVSFINQSTPNNIHSTWSFGDGGSSNDHSPIYTYNTVGEYVVILTVADDFGCYDTASVILKVVDIPTIYIPNAFSPDGDSKNPTFGPKGANLNIENYQIIIYSRWGDVVFETKDFYTQWNGAKYNAGEVLPHGIYVYRMKIKLVDEILIDRVGDVLLLR